jgi:hypothetical protein
LGLVDLPVDLELAEHGVGHSSFQAAERFEAGLALGDLALVGVTAGSVEPDLGDGCHVDGPVELPVAGARQPVPVDVTGRHRDRGGAAVAGELVAVDEPGDVLTAKAQLSAGLPCPISRAIVAGAGFEPATFGL